jgi:GT2 family glycosyltransferase
MKKVFVIILNWNGREMTPDCLRFLVKLNTKNIELNIVVVDNASTDGSIKALKKFSPFVKLLCNQSNLGFAGGNNVGIKYALKNGADFILILNNDTIINKNLLVQLVEVAEKRKDAGILSPKVYFAPGFEFHKDRYRKDDLGKVIWYAGGNLDWDNIYGENRGVDEVDKGQYDQICEIDFATGACCLFRREALLEVGLFNEKYFMYLEDAELSQRIKRKGWKVLYAPPAYLWHKVAQSSAVGSELNDYFITRNRLLFGMSYASLRTKFALIRESLRLLRLGRKWQKIGVKDFYLRKFGKGSWK